MRDILIVDGYNIVNAWPELIKLKSESFEHARDKLLDILANYQGLEGCLVVVVFDAHLVKGGIGTRDNYAGVEVIFTQEGETADSCIERLVTLLPEKMSVTVATSDWAQQRLVMGQGALRLSARELLEKVNKAESRSCPAADNIYKSHLTVNDIIDTNMRSTLERWRRGKK
ncbi:MAG: NYN domain-containing protein [Bacillota bacterium]